jgi:hypothetical protein
VETASYLLESALKDFMPEVARELAYLPQINLLGVRAQAFKLKVSFHLFSQFSHNRTSFFGMDYPPAFRRKCRRTLIWKESYSKKFRKEAIECDELVLLKGWING